MCDVYLHDKNFETLLKSFILKDCNGSLLILKFSGIKEVETEYSISDVIVDVKNSQDSLVWTGSLVNFVKNGIYKSTVEFDCFEVRDGKLIIWVY